MSYKRELSEYARAYQHHRKKADEAWDDKDGAEYTGRALVADKVLQMLAKLCNVLKSCVKFVCLYLGSRALYMCLRGVVEFRQNV
jgi:hypothetical protein